MMRRKQIRETSMKMLSKCSQFKAFKGGQIRQMISSSYLSNAFFGGLATASVRLCVQSIKSQHKFQHLLDLSCMAIETVKSLVSETPTHKLKYVLEPLITQRCYNKLEDFETTLEMMEKRYDFKFEKIVAVKMCQIFFQKSFHLYPQSLAKS